MAHLTNFSFEFLYEIFTEDASLPFLYHGAKKSKMTKNSNQGGSCLNINRFFVDGIQIKTRETAARIVLEDDIFRAMTRQVQYMAIHCTLK